MSGSGRRDREIVRLRPVSYSTLKQNDDRREIRFIGILDQMQRLFEEEVGNAHASQDVGLDHIVGP